MLQLAQIQGTDQLRTDVPICCVYCIWNTQTGEQYVGATIHLRHRLMCTASSMRGTKSNAASTALCAAAREYGVESFAASVIQLCRSEDEADQVETQIIEARKPKYNVRPGGGKVRASRVKNGQVLCCGFGCDAEIDATRVFCDACTAEWTSTPKGRQTTRRLAIARYYRAMADPVRKAHLTELRRANRERQKSDPSYREKQRQYKRDFMARIKADPEKFEEFKAQRRAKAKARRAKRAAEKAAKNAPKTKRGSGRTKSKAKGHRKARRGQK